MHKRALNTAVRRQLARELGLVHAGAVVVGTIIGNDIVLVRTEIWRVFRCSTYLHTTGGRHWSEYLL
jgi:hypothetical protein